MDVLSNAVQKVKASPLWFVAPSLAVAAAIALTVSGYTPLTFDPSLHQTQSALASELTTLDAESLEGGAATPLSAGGETSFGVLEDGTWTGYAACGQGNADDWKPYYVAVTIRVEGGVVVAIESIAGTSMADGSLPALSWDASENQRYLDAAVAGVKAQMESRLAQGSVAAIDAVSGATFSSTAIYNACIDAIRRAGGNVGDAAMQASAQAKDQASLNLKADSSLSGADFADGTWTGYAVCGNGNDDGWSPYYVAVTVKVKGGKVVSVTSVSGSSTGDSGSARLAWNASENQKYLSWATSGRNGNRGVKSQLNSQLSSRDSVSSIDTVSGATYSSEAIYEAYTQALSKAAKAAGKKATSTKKKTSKKTASKSSSKKKSVSTDGDSQVASATLADGSWIGYYACGTANDDGWDPYYVAVTVTVSGGKVTGIAGVSGSATGDTGAAKLAWDASQNQRYLSWAQSGRTKGGVSYTGVVDQIVSAVKAGKSVTSIDVVAGATYSSEAIAKAYFAALKKSAAAAGATIDEPDDVSGGGSGSGSGSGDDGDEGDDSGSGDGSADSGVSDDASGTGGDDSGGDGGSGGSGSGGGDSDDEQGSSAALVDGTYVGRAYCENLDEDYWEDWDSYHVLVTVQVEGGKITGITGVSGDSDMAASNAIYLRNASNGTTRRKGVIAQINEQIAAGIASVSGIDVIAGATYSSNAILAGYNDALSQM